MKMREGVWGFAYGNRRRGVSECPALTPPPPSSHPSLFFLRLLTSPPLNSFLSPSILSVFSLSPSLSLFYRLLHSPSSPPSSSFLSIFFVFFFRSLHFFFYSSCLPHSSFLSLSHISLVSSSSLNCFFYSSPSVLLNIPLCFLCSLYFVLCPPSEGHAEYTRNLFTVRLEGRAKTEDRI